MGLFAHTLSGISPQTCYITGAFRRPVHKNVITCQSTLQSSGTYSSFVINVVSKQDGRVENNYLFFSSLWSHIVNSPTCTGDEWNDLVLVSWWLEIRDRISQVLHLRSRDRFTQQAGNSTRPDWSKCCFTGLLTRCYISHIEQQGSWRGSRSLALAIAQTA